MNEPKDVYFVAVKVLLRRGNELLITHDVFDNWDIPGGRLKPDEFSAPLEDVIARVRNLARTSRTNWASPRYFSGTNGSNNLRASRCAFLPLVTRRNILAAISSWVATTTPTNGSTWQPLSPQITSPAAGSKVFRTTCASYDQPIAAPDLLLSR